jgi:hypothetical protein
MKNGFKPCQVLLAQIHPETFFGNDIFSPLFELYSEKVSHIELRSFRPYYNCVVIDDIQHLVESPTVFKMSQALRPFLSPLILHSKNMGVFPRFIISGTGMNFEYIKNVLGSQSLKELSIHYTDLRPLNSGATGQVKGG